jgi:glutaredoxin
VPSIQVAEFVDNTGNFIDEVKRIPSQTKDKTMSKAVFYHAGCPVCVEAEQQLASAIDSSKYEVEVVHFGDAKESIPEAEASGVKSVPALVLEGQAFHINFGASLEDVKKVLA